MMDRLLDEWIDEAMGVTTIIRAFKWSRGHSYFPELPRSSSTKRLLTSSEQRGREKEQEAWKHVGVSGRQPKKNGK